MDGKIFDKLEILAEGAKYDVSCSSSGAARGNTLRIGNAACAGICHSWTADGRCISLLKVLLSNDCVYDCKYCVNRRSADVARTSFEPKELADLTIEFYRRNYIEGLFLSSAVIGSPDETALKMYECLYMLREVYGFGGYVHAKVIPGVSAELLMGIGLVSDRLSVNIEAPSRESLALLAPQKQAESVFSAMSLITATQHEQRTLKAAGNMARMKPAGLSVLLGEGSLAEVRAGAAEVYRASETRLGPGGRGRRYHEAFAPAGQTTQMIVGASPESDRHILHTSERLYSKFAMKRVYFSAYIPVSNDPALPSMLTPPPLKREHRLYQADWLLRFYGFSAGEILTEAEPNLDTELDPKVIWALRHLDVFPMEVNRASEEELLRIPGVGNTSVYRIMRQRKLAPVGYDDLKKMGVVLKRAKYFITCAGKYYGDTAFDPASLRAALGGGLPPQVSLFETSTPLAPALQVTAGKASRALPGSHRGESHPGLAAPQTKGNAPALAQRSSAYELPV